MAKDVSQSVRESLSQALTAVTQGMTAPDAAPYMPILSQLHQLLVGVIQKGNAGPGQQGMGQAPPPGMGAPPGGGGPPGPPAQGFAGAGGRGIFPNSPQPNAQELQALIGSRTGM